MNPRARRKRNETSCRVLALRRCRNVRSRRFSSCRRLNLEDPRPAQFATGITSRFDRCYAYRSCIGTNKHACARVVGLLTGVDKKLLVSSCGTPNVAKQHKNHNKSTHQPLPAESSLCAHDSRQASSAYFRGYESGKRALPAPGARPALFQLAGPVRWRRSTRSSSLSCATVIAAPFDLDSELLPIATNITCRAAGSRKLRMTSATMVSIRVKPASSQCRSGARSTSMFFTHRHFLIRFMILMA